MIILSLTQRRTIPLLWFTAASSVLGRPDLLFIPSFSGATTNNSNNNRNNNHPSHNNFQGSRYYFSTSPMSSSGNNNNNKVVVSIPDAIQAHENKEAKFVDGSWFLKGRNGRQEYEAGPRILGAKFFDIDDIASPSPKNLPHMMPPKELFASAMDAMNISNQDPIIVYATKDCMFVHRAWFQIKNMGHSQVYILDGSLSDWQNQGGPIEEGPTTTFYAKDLPPATKYQAQDAQNIVDMNEMIHIINNNSDKDMIVDVRSQERFLGQVEEPRPNMRLGHMPGAKNLPFNQLLDPDNINKFKSLDEIKSIIDETLQIDNSKAERIIMSCGSGATACCLVAALQLTGIPSEKCYVYDGSWSEWGADDNTPIVKEEG